MVLTLILSDLNAWLRATNYPQRRLSSVALAALLAAGLVACESKADRQDRARALEAQRANAALRSAEADAEFQHRQAADWDASNAAAKKVGVGRICRAAIASLMGQSPSIIRATPAKDATSDQGMTVRTRYVRPSDGTVWRSECAVAGNRVIWATINDDGSVGRKRNEDQIFYSATGDTINISQVMDGVNVSNETFTVR